MKFLYAAKESIKWYLSAQSLRMTAFGFAAGLPLTLVISTLSFRMREAGIDLATISMFSWIGMAYAFKWMWAPFVDTVDIPYLSKKFGNRVDWIILTQILIIIGIIAMAFTNPQNGVKAILLSALIVAFSSATQDIAIDAWRIESAEEKYQASLAASYQAGYKIAIICAGAGTLWIAARAQKGVFGADNISYYNSWKIAYISMAACMLIGIISALTSPKIEKPKIKKITKDYINIIEPITIFFIRYGYHSITILLLVSIYRISDVIMGVMAQPFYIDMGYSKDEIVTVVKTWGIIMGLLGAFIGGILVNKAGLWKILLLGAILSSGTNLLYAAHAVQNPDINILTIIVSADNLASGIAAAAFIAYLSSLTQTGYSGTQYALLSSLMIIAPKFIAGFSGKYVNEYGYSNFFTATAIIGLPVILLIITLLKNPIIQGNK